jgi:hypothetical protein
MNTSENKSPKTSKVALAIALPLLLSTLAAPRAFGQAAGAAGGGDQPAGDQPAANAEPKVKIQKGPGGRKTYVIKDEIRIEGKIQKPEAFFFYQKSSINYDWQELKQDFIPKILDSVSHAPF